MVSLCLENVINKSQDKAVKIKLSGIDIYEIIVSGNYAYGVYLRHESLLFFWKIQIPVCGSSLDIFLV